MQVIHAGRGSASELPVLLAKRGYRRLFLVTGSDSYRASGAQALLDELLAPFEVTLFNAFTPNITLEDALEGSRQCRAANADAIVAVGGGSPIDMAKCVAAFLLAPGCERAVACGEVEVAAAALPIAAIPTTGGTGSESTHFAVIYIDGKKYSLTSEHLLPAIALLDPTLTDALPPYLTACCGFDALSQAIESCWAVAATPASRRLACEAIGLILEHLPAAVNAPTAIARDAMMHAANLAGQAIAISRTTAPHALSYTITSRWGVPHGHAVALTLGAFFALHASAEADLRVDAAIVNGVVLSALGADDAGAAKQRWYQLMEQCGLGVSLGRDTPVDEAAMNAIVAGVNLERLANHPLPLKSAQLAALLRSIPWQRVSA